MPVSTVEPPGEPSAGEQHRKNTRHDFNDRRSSRGRLRAFEREIGVWAVRLEIQRVSLTIQFNDQFQRTRPRLASARHPFAARATL